MRLFIYSDVHISRTSSILPVTSGMPNYTYRQNMIIKTARWMSDLIQQNNIDLIINLGDTFDQNTVTSYDIDTASEFFKMFPKDKEHLVLCGNHEMLNDKYNALKLLNNIDKVQVIDTPTVIDNLLFIPYCDYKDLDLSQFNGSDYAFMHHDIYGSQIAPGRTLDFGIERDSLSKFKKVFNGHVHANSEFGNIVNVGSVTTHSFADSLESLPSCFIFDTVTQKLEQYYNGNCPLFRKVKADTIQELKDNIQNIDGKIMASTGNAWSYVFHIECDFDIKDEVSSILNDSASVLNYKITTKSIKQNEQVQKDTENLVIESNLDIKQSFKDFLNTGVELKYPMSLFDEVVGETQKTQKENDTAKVLIQWARECGLDVGDKDKFENTTSVNMNTLF